MLAIGIGLYFALPTEPPLAIAIVAPVISIGSAYAFTRTSAARPGFVVLLSAASLAAIGFAAASIRTHTIAAPVLVADTGFVTIEGRLLEVEEGPSGRRMLIAPRRIGSLDEAALPARVRVSWRGEGFPVSPGETISLRGSLAPPPGPVMPGAYDFARQLYFDRIGATGFAVSPPRTIEADGSARAGIEALRLSLGRRITSAIGARHPEAAAVCVALITGKRNAVPPDVEAALRDAGLAHLLAISGLHIGLVAGLLFMLVRFILVQSEYLALHHPVKKWAALAALAGAAFYLLISGGAWSTQRAFIMAAIAFIAILLDRRALSLRNVAIAAALILILRPEALFQAGFQMSFAAVTVLIAGYEWWQARRLTRDPGALDNKGPIARVRRYVTGLAATSLLAGVATGPFAIFHFNRIAAFGLAGNLLAMPLMGTIVMPGAILGILLIPLGLDWIGWSVMGWGIEMIIAIARFVSSWPGALVPVAQTGLAGFLLVIGGGLIVCLMRSPLRLAGSVPILLGILIGGMARQPDVLIAPSAANVSMRLDDEIVLLNRNRERFAAGIWLAKAGRDDALRSARRLDELGDAAGEGPSPARCDSTGCVANVGNRRIAVSRSRLALGTDCRMADIVIAQYEAGPAGGRCPATLIDTVFLEREGTTALYLTGRGIRVRTVRQARGDRPWAAGGHD